MARAPKIPGLRSWRKTPHGEPGHRPVWSFFFRSGHGVGPRTRVHGFHIQATPRKASQGPITGYYGSVLPSGDAVTPTLRTKTDVIKALRKWTRERARTNPLTAPEAAEVDDRRAAHTAQSQRYRRAGQLESAAHHRGAAEALTHVHDDFAPRGFPVHRGAEIRHEHEGPGRPTRRRPMRGNPGLAYEDLGPGDRVTILVPAGRGRQGVEYRERTGRVVMRGPAGWVLNLGGTHGTPGIATPENFVRATKGKPSERHHGFGTLGRRGNPVADAPRSVNPTRRVSAQMFPHWQPEDAFPRRAEAVARAKELRTDGYQTKIEDEGASVRLRYTVYIREHARSRSNPARRTSKRRNPSATLCRHTLPLAKGQHHKVTVCYPQGVFPSLKAAVLNIQKELRARFGRLKGAPAVRAATWAYTNQAQTRGRWTFAG